MPRHPPCALSCLALPDTIALVPDGLGCCLVFVSQFAVSYYSASFSSLSLRLTYSRCFVYAVFKVRCWQSINTLPNGDKEIRTLDPLLARQVLSQLSYIPILIRQPPAFPCRLQHSIIGLPGLNHRVRDGYGCVPWAYRHRKDLVIHLLGNSTVKHIHLLLLP